MRKQNLVLRLENNRRLEKYICDWFLRALFGIMSENKIKNEGIRTQLGEDNIIIIIIIFIASH